MKRCLLLIIFSGFLNFAFSQNVGIVRKNYFSSYYDSLINMNIDVFDSATIRLGVINPLSGIITNLNSSEYSISINLTGATIDPYQKHYYIGSGFNLLTFDYTSGDLLNSAPISGPLSSASFQNFRFNPSDSLVYGMIPQNFYSSYFDSLSMSVIEVLDSSVIRFGFIEPATGNYSLIGNSSYKNIYTLAGNSIDPFQMVYYYSAVDTLIGIDLYTGAPFSVVPIQLPAYSIFENIAYSCADTSIYGLTRQNFTSMVFDSLFMDSMQVIDSTNFRLSKIDPNTGVVTFISPVNIQMGGNLTGGAFIDPISMTYFFNHGNEIVGVSMITGLISSAVVKTYPSGEMAFDMMRSTQNCFGVTKMRTNAALSVNDLASKEMELVLYPNPVQNELRVSIQSALQSISIFDINGHLLLESNENSVIVKQLPNGFYFAKITTVEGQTITQKFIKL